MTTSVEARNIVIKKHHRVVIDNMSFSIKENDLFVFLGEKNSGKTEMVKILSSIIKPTEGEILIYGENNTKSKKLVSYIPQNMALSRQLTVYENMELVLRVNGFNILNIRENIEAILEEYDLIDRADDMANTLSEGLKKRLSIAMGLATSPKILLIDEPTDNLNSKAKRDILKMISNLKGKYTIIICTNSADFAELLDGTVCILYNGKVKDIGSVSKLKEKYNKSYLEDILIDFTEEE